MQTVSSINDLKKWHSQQVSKNLGFVPTMGALHEGHASLIEAAREQNEIVVVSIFVNPLQFGPNEDLSKYPKTLEADLALCKEKGADLVFLPNAQELYPAGLNKLSKVKPIEELANCLCGLTRPGHFEGVLTVVLKLFNLVRPQRAYFGEKDYQQLALIKQMVVDFNLDIEIVPMPIMRTQSGLALSSRNKYLTEQELSEAVKLSETLNKTKELIKAGNSISDVLKKLQQTYFEYFEARDPNTLELTNKLPARLFIAAKIGTTRLIDNCSI
jgi:pantoate--beta-alanine ligase